MDQTIKHNIYGDVLTIEKNILDNSIKFNYYNNNYHVRYETLINQSDINRLCPLFSAYPNYYWKLFNIQPGITIRASDMTLRWNIELKYMDDQPVEINLQLAADNADTLVTDNVDASVTDKADELIINNMNQQIQLFIERNNVLNNFNKIMIIRNIWGLHNVLLMCGYEIFHDYFAGFDFSNREDKYVQRFYNVLANCTFAQITMLTPVFKALENKLDPNYPITTAPQNEAADIITNVGMDTDKMHTLFTRIVHCMMQVIALNDSGVGYNYKASVEKNKGNVHTNVSAHLLLLNSMANNADFTKLLCGTSKANPAAGTIKQLADRWFEPMIRHVGTLLRSDENEQTIETLTKLRAATWL